MTFTGSKINLFVALGSVMFGQGCKVSGPADPKKSDNSNLESLGNFGGQKTIWNECTGTKKSLAPEGAVVSTSNTVSASVTTSLTAVPESLQKEFFVTSKGKIEVVQTLPCADKNPEKNPPKSAGKDADKDADTSASIACQDLRKDTSGISIYIKAGSNEAETIRNVRHAVVRGFGYFLADVMLGETTKATTADTAATREVKGTIAAAYLDDIASSKGKYQLSTFKERVEPSVLVANLSSEARLSAWEAVASSPKSLSFATAVFAETFDSLNCSDATRTELTKDFTGVTRKMQAIQNELAAFFGDPSGVAPVNETTTKTASQTNKQTEKQITNDELALWGQGFGNGPLRNGLRNWGSFRQQGGGIANWRQPGNGWRRFWGQ